MPNESTSGFTDEQLQQITEIAQQSAQQAANSAVGEISGAFGEMQGYVVSSLPSVVASALDSRSGSVNTVSIAGDQWESLSGYVVLSRDSVRLQNSVMLLELLLVAAIIGVLFFGHFSKGFRRD